MWVLAWIPFLEPMHFMQGLWYVLAIPLVIGIAMVHKGLRLPEHGLWLRAVSVMALQSLLGLISLAIVLYVLVLWIVPQL